MRNRQLHAAVAAFAEEAAWQLAADAAEGAEVPFEVVEAGGGRRDVPLYCYRPLTGAFIEERASLLGRLPSYLPAVHALAACPGVDAYLAACGEAQVPADPRRRAEEALRLLLARVFRDSTDFALVPERLHAAYDELEALVLEGRALVEVVAAVHGLAIASDEIALGDSLLLARADRCTDLPPEVCAPRADGRPPVVVALRWEAAPGDEAPLRHAEVRLRRLLCGLRLYDAVPVALARTGWSRTGAGRWQPFALGESAPPVRGVLAVPPAQEDELRAFLSLVGRRTPRHGEVAWALHRFELACSRSAPADALTDVLLALRALLDPEGANHGRLAARVAALCALPDAQAQTIERVVHAAELERALVAGVGPGDEALQPLGDELTAYLRAVLRDVLCGHLEADLRAVADGLLARADEQQGTIA
ncbi:hypothetical protein [Conexibacter sp. SYSU D00693]|uniref:hypothetical protein n=1 Tax=Conexibacter sp. SYSU D00693 TaxID=2812560 RepID=UPI00196B67C1|nr:hypothetical protein [Conexibacter sp. SYSU D00693]